MHKRNKGKNKPHKNPNPPTPQQQVKLPAVVAVPESDKVEDKHDEKDIRVPEIVPEIVATPQDIDACSTAVASETPLKPKRHRAGKKKKLSENKEETCEKIEESSDPATDLKLEKEVLCQTDKQFEEFKKNDENKKDVKETEKSVKDLLDSKPDQTEVVIPSSRKKKGKQQKREQEISSAENKVGNVDQNNPLSNDITCKAISPADFSENIPISEPDWQETNSGKKKNKNKKKALTEMKISNVKSNDNKTTINSETLIDLETSEIQKKDISQKEDILSDVIPKLAMFDTVSNMEDEMMTKDEKQILCGASKNKKSNKKEKVMAREEDVTDSNSQKLEDKKTQRMTQNITTKVIKKIEELDVDNLLLEIAEQETNSSSAILSAPKPISKDAEGFAKDDLLMRMESSDGLKDIIPEPVRPMPPMLESSDDNNNTLDKVLKTEDMSCLTPLAEKQSDPQYAGKSLETFYSESHQEKTQLFEGKKSTLEFILPLYTDNTTESLELVAREKCYGKGQNLRQASDRNRTQEMYPNLQDATPPVLVASSTIDEAITSTSQLKTKVMEVNKDMEDLKISIEKSLAELTALESVDDMPALVAITEQETPEKNQQQKAVPVINVETQVLSIPKITPTIAMPSFAEAISFNTCNLIKPVDPKQSEKGETKSDHTIPDKNIDLQKPISSLGDTTVNCQEHILQKGKGKSKKKTKVEQSTHQAQPTEAQTSSPKADTKTSKSETTKDSSTENKCVTKPIEEPEKKSDSADTVSESKQFTSNENITGINIVENTHTKDEKPNDNGLANECKSKDNFEDALTTSSDDINKSFEVLTDATTHKSEEESAKCSIPIGNQDMFLTPTQQSDLVKPPEEKQKTENPLITHPKNLLGHPDIPVTSSKNDYKKEKNKKQTPNSEHAKIKIQDSVKLESKEKEKKNSQHSQTDNKLKKLNSKKNTKKETSIFDSDSEEDEYVYKYSFRKVFLTNACHVCMSDLKSKRLACGHCNLIFYCGQNHKDEDWPEHQALCFAVSTIVNLKGLKFIYADAKGVNGQNYRLLRMQVIVSCEKILKRRLQPSEQETLLYPRLCADPDCREWRSVSLKDCDGCGQVAYCADNPQHLPKQHQLWCAPYRLYQKLVCHQHNKGRLEPKLPTRIISDKNFKMLDKINEMLAQLYEEKLDMDDVHYAALTQLATAPLTALYALQLYQQAERGTHSKQTQRYGDTLTVHVVGAELQFEADALVKWEVFLLHARPGLRTLRVVLVGPELNPAALPLDLLANVRMCRACRAHARRVIFDFQDGQLYHQYAASDQFTQPDIVCAFNPGLYRSAGFRGTDSWPETINCILKLNVPFCVTSYTRHELPRDLARVKMCAQRHFDVLLEPTPNPYASVRPDRNFISDDEMPLIFKNYYFMLLAGRV